MEEKGFTVNYGTGLTTENFRIPKCYIFDSVETKNGFTTIDGDKEVHTSRYQKFCGFTDKEVQVILSEIESLKTGPVAIYENRPFIINESVLYWTKQSDGTTLLNMHAMNQKQEFTISKSK